ncbi:MAG TPA: histidinol-phosphate transaminase [Verrucomicrobiae bacterium]|nr:histidinol-phosphate transaminase [Verrucomicrobiae bacterium]
MKSAAKSNVVPTEALPEARRHLFYETSHSPALADLVGYEKAGDIIDFCFIANPYYPTPAMLDDMQRHFPNLIKSYPSSNPELSQRHLAAVLHVEPENLIIGNGATELIVLINTILIDRIAVPVPTFGEYIEKLKEQQDADLYFLDAKTKYELNLGDYLAWVRRENLKALLVINPGNPTGQLIPLDEMVEFLERARHLDLVIVDESFIDFAGDPVPSLLPVANRFQNLLIVRSMSKHCGVPGLRLGYCHSVNKPLLDRLRRFVPTWNLNTLAQYFLSLLPATDSDYHVARKRLMEDAHRLYSALKTIPNLDVYPTGANFVLFKITNGMTAADLQARLLTEYQMYVRDCSNKVGMDVFHVRVASQGRDKDARLVEALRTLTR